MSVRNKLKVSSSASLEYRVMLFAPPAFDLSPFNFDLGGFAEPISQAEPAQQFTTQDFGSFDLTRFGLGVGSFSDPVSESAPAPQPQSQDFGAISANQFDIGQSVDSNTQFNSTSSAYANMVNAQYANPASAPESFILDDAIMSYLDSAMAQTAASGNENGGLIVQNRDGGIEILAQQEGTPTSMPLDAGDPRINGRPVLGYAHTHPTWGSQGPSSTDVAVLRKHPTGFEGWRSGLLRENGTTWFYVNTAASENATFDQVDAAYRAGNLDSVGIALYVSEAPGSNRLVRM